MKTSPTNRRSHHKPRPTPTTYEQSSNSTENIVEWDLTPKASGVTDSQQKEEHTIAEDLVQEGINEAEDDYRNHNNEMLI